MSDSDGRVIVAPALVLALALASAGAAAAQPTATAATAIDRPAVVAFLGTLHRAVASKDRKALADLMRYPLTVSAAGLTIPVADRTAFFEYADLVVTDAMVEAIAAAHDRVRAGATNTPQVRVSAADVVVGARLVVAQPVAGRLLVTRLALPSLDRGWRAARREAQRIRFGPGEPPARRSGALARGESEAYLLTVRQGQLLSLRLDEVQGRTVVARLVDAQSGTPLDPRADEGVRAWTGRLRRDTDLRIVVTRLAGTEPALGYLLRVDLR